MKPFVWKDRTGEGRWLAIAGIELKRFETYAEAFAWATSPERGLQWATYSTKLRDSFLTEREANQARPARPQWWEVTEFIDNLVNVSEPTA